MSEETYHVAQTSTVFAPFIPLGPTSSPKVRRHSMMIEARIEKTMFCSLKARERLGNLAGVRIRQLLLFMLCHCNSGLQWFVKRLKLSDVRSSLDSSSAVQVYSENGASNACQRVFMSRLAAVLKY